MYHLSPLIKKENVVYRILLYEQTDILILKNQMFKMMLPDINVIMVTISEELAKEISSIHLNDPNYENCTVFTKNNHWLACTDHFCFSKKENVLIENSDTIKKWKDFFNLSKWNEVKEKQVDLWIKVYWVLNSQNKYKLNPQIVKIEFKN